MRILTLTAVLATGCASNANLAAHPNGSTAGTFAQKTDVFLATGDWPEGVYGFEVTDRHGTPLSLDGDNCRRFHVDVNGMITAALGDTCAHAWANDQHHHGSLTIQLAPFSDATDGTYTVFVMSAGVEVAYDSFRVQ